jgi:methylase of polypeptide subunit release factors
MLFILFNFYSNANGGCYLSLKDMVDEKISIDLLNDLCSDVIICNAPYINYENRCCLDLDGDGLCD